MADANSASDFAECWESYLVALKAVGEILLTGSKGHNQARQLLETRWIEVTSDPLLKYLIEARNVEEHGLEPTAEFAGPSLGIGGPGESVRLDGTIGPGGTLRVTPLNGSNVTITYSPKSARLLPVKDRKGNTWPVPDMHLAKVVSDQAPISVATLGLAYFSRLVEDASSLA